MAPAYFALISFTFKNLGSRESDGDIWFHLLQQTGSWLRQRERDREGDITREREREREEETGAGEKHRLTERQNGLLESAFFH